MTKRRGEDADTLPKPREEQPRVNWAALDAFMLRHRSEASEPPHEPGTAHEPAHDLSELIPAAGA